MPPGWPRRAARLAVWPRVHLAMALLEFGGDLLAVARRGHQRLQRGHHPFDSLPRRGGQVRRNHQRPHHFAAIAQRDRGPIPSSPGTSDGSSTANGRSSTSASRAAGRVQGGVRDLQRAASIARVRPTGRLRAGAVRPRAHAVAPVPPARWPAAPGTGNTDSRDETVGALRVDVDVHRRAGQRCRHGEPETPAGRHDEHAEQEDGTERVFRRYPFQLFDQTNSAAMKPAATSTPSQSGGAVGRTTSARNRRYRFAIARSSMGHRADRSARRRSHHLRFVCVWELSPLLNAHQSPGLELTRP